MTNVLYIVKSLNEQSGVIYFWAGVMAREIVLCELLFLSIFGLFLENKTDGHVTLQQ